MQINNVSSFKTMNTLNEKLFTFMLLVADFTIKNYAKKLINDQKPSKWVLI